MAGTLKTSHTPSGGLTRRFRESGHRAPVGPGGWDCACCAPPRRKRRYYGKKARKLLKQEDRKQFQKAIGEEDGGD